MSEQLSYASAGVDVEAGERAVALMRASVARATRPEAVGDFGGFAGLFDASALAKYRRPLLATSTDGVGTKVAVAQRMDKHDTIGIDLVAMVVDDLVVCGAEPLFMTDYIATGLVVPQLLQSPRHLQRHITHCLFMVNRVLEKLTYCALSFQEVQHASDAWACAQEHQAFAAQHLIDSS